MNSRFSGPTQQDDGRHPDFATLSAEVESVKVDLTRIADILWVEREDRLADTARNIASRLGDLAQALQGRSAC